MVASFLGGAGVADLLHRGELVVPTYTFPEAAAASLGHAAAYQAWHISPPASYRTSRESTPSAPARWSPHAPRARSPRRSPPSCWPRTESPYATPDRKRNGPDAFLSVSSDPVFGPVVSFGLTGDYADLMADVAHRVTPLSDRDAREMVRSLRAAPLLDGRAGGRGVDLAALEETVLRISAMVDDLPEIESLELRPVRLLPPGDGIAVAHATIRLTHHTTGGGPA